MSNIVTVVRSVHVVQHLLFKLTYCLQSFVLLITRLRFILIRIINGTVYTAVFITNAVNILTNLIFLAGMRQI